MRIASPQTNSAHASTNAKRERQRVLPSICRNCGFEAPGRYCSNCGQETTLELPTAGKFLREAAGRYVAFDGRMWRSLGALLFRPGFLTREYFAGRRRRYVRPARLFVALSIVFFAILRYSAGPTVVVESPADVANRDQVVEEGVADANSFGVRIDRGLNVHIETGRSPALAGIQRRIDAFNRLSREDKVDQLIRGILRFAPYAAIGLLPLFALLLSVAYAGRSNRYPTRPRRYAAHLVFGAHHHAFVFLAASLLALTPSGLLSAALVTWMIVYSLMSMKAVYDGSWIGVALRAMIIFAVYFVFFGLAVAALLLAAVMLR
jgi:hypothetical protein